MTNEWYYVGGLLIQIVVMICVVYNTRNGQNEQERKKAAQQREEDLKLSDSRHRDNKDMIHTLSNSVHSILLTVTSFDAWKLGHEVRCDDRYVEMKESMERFRISLDGAVSEMREVQAEMRDALRRGMRQ